MNDKYILAVASLNYRKNLISLIKAFNMLSLRDIKLFLVGDLNPNFAYVDLFKEIKQNKTAVSVELKGDQRSIIFFVGG